jgi:Uma2 family endonuclease
MPPFGVQRNDHTFKPFGALEGRGGAGQRDATLLRMRRGAERSQLTVAEYLAWERAQETKHEHFDGEVFAMAGGSLRHNALAVRMGEALRGALRRRGCEVLSSDQKIGLGQRYMYPDLVVVCGAVAIEAETSDVLTNPTVVVEVLSGSTEQYDRGLKWEGYQRVASLTDYLLVGQVEPRVEQFRRERDGVWTYRSLGAGQRVELTGGAELDIDRIFAGVFELPGD